MNDNEIKTLLQNSKVALTDEDPQGKLKNYCYINCDKDTDENIKCIRGLI